MADLGKQFLDTDGLNALWTKHKKVQPFYQEIGTSGTNGWVNFLTVKCTTYMNHPLVVRLLCRGYSDSTMDVQFVSANNTTPTIQYFKQRIQPYSGTQAIAKPGYTSEDVDGVRYYKFWLKKNEGYGAIGVHVESEYFYTNGAEDTGLLTFPNVQSDTEPSGIVYVANSDIVYETVPAKTAVSAAAVKVGTNAMGQVVLGNALAPSDLGISATTTSVTVGSTTTNIPQATSTSPKMDGTAAVGTETTWAKGDHVHPTDTSRAPTSHASSATTYGIGTTANYGHVKLATGDMNGATHADGVAVSKNHTHSQYVPTTRTVNGHALSSDVTVTASDISAVRYDTASQGLTDTQKSNARTNIGAGTSNLTIGTTSTTAAAGNHTHTTALATDSGTATVELAHATTYKLTAGGTSVIFKTPSDNNTDTKVKATAKTDNVNYKILATASASPTSGEATEAVYDADISLNPSTNTISANVSGTSASAGKLTTARKTYVTLGTASTTTTRDWSGDTTIPVNGTLGIGNGGTGATDAAGARTNLAVYSKTEVDSMLSGRISVVASLPSTGEAGVIYYVGPTGSGSDQYDEYIWSNNAFVKVGEHSLDLSNYVNTVTTSGSGSVVTGVSKSGNTVTVTKGNIAINNLSDWASNSDVVVGGVTYHTWWPTSPTSSNQVYGLSIYNGKLYQVYNNKGTYSVRSYDQDNNTTYTNASLGQGYGTCSTAQATAAKEVTLADYALTKGGIVAVKFTNALCEAATLNINGKGAKSIYIKGAAVSSSTVGTVGAGDLAYFMYDGSVYHLLGTDRAATNPIVNITRSGTTFTATRLDGTTFNFTQQDNNTTYTQEKLGQGYGTCTTAEATAAKVVALTNYELVTNGVVAVKFSYNLCAAATLNINSKGAKPVYVGGAAVTLSNCKVVQAGDLAFFIYDGTAYHFICTDRIAKTGITGLSVSGTTITYTKADGSTGTFDTQDTTYVFDGTYNASSNKAATVSTVTNAINALDVSDISGFGAGKTLATLTETNGKIAATFQNISITKSQVSDFSHTHGNITNGGALQTTDITIADGDKLVVTDSSDSNKVARASISFDGSTTTQALTKAGTWATFNNYSHPAGSAPSKTGVPTGNVSPSFGGTFKVNQITTDSTSHVSAVTERTITIPNSTATTSAAGLMSAGDKTKLNNTISSKIIDNVKVLCVTKPITAGWYDNQTIQLYTGYYNSSGYGLTIGIRQYSATTESPLANLSVTIERDTSYTFGTTPYYKVDGNNLVLAFVFGAKTKFRVTSPVTDMFSNITTSDTWDETGWTALPGSINRFHTWKGGTVAIGDTNTPVYADTTGEIKACTSYADATVGTANKPSGFTGYSTSAVNWGTLSDTTKYDAVTNWSNDGGNIAFAKDKSAPSGHPNKTLSVQVDGYFYQNEGNYRVLDTSDVTSTYSSTGTSPVNGTAVTAAIGGLDVSSVGGDGKYISAISETDGKISATATTMDTAPTLNSNNAVASNGIKLYTLPYSSALVYRGSTTGESWYKVCECAGPNANSNVIGVFEYCIATDSVIYNGTIYVNVRGGSSSSVAPTVKRANIKGEAALGTDKAQIQAKLAVVGLSGGNCRVQLWLYRPASYNAISIREVQSGNFSLSTKANWTYTSYTTGSAGSAAPVTDASTNTAVTDFSVTQFSMTDHTHGNITSGGALQTTDITIASGDKLVVTDSSDSSKVARTSITFDGSTTTQALTKAGTWATFNNYSHPAGSAASKTGVPTADATPGFGGTFKVNQITTDSTSHVSAVTERTITIPNTTATASAAGLMSADDYKRLNGSRDIGEHDADLCTADGFYYGSSNMPATALGWTDRSGGNDGALFVQAYNTTWVGQIAQDYRTGNLFTRGKNNGTFTSWKRIPYLTVKNKGGTTTPVYVDDNGEIQSCTTYAGGTAVTLNGTSASGSTATFYAPTGAGTSNYVLKSNGSGAPTWVEKAPKAVVSDYVNQMHTNEVNFKNVPTSGNKERVWFNYRNGDTDAAAPDNLITAYYFGNRNQAITGVTLWADNFSGTSNYSSNTKVTTATQTKAYLAAANSSTTYTNGAQTSLLADTGVYLTTTAGELNATQFKVNEHCTMQYNSTKSSLDFVFS